MAESVSVGWVAGAIIFGFLPDFIKPYNDHGCLTRNGWIVGIGFIIFLIVTLISTYQKNNSEKRLRQDILSVIQNNNVKNLHSLIVPNKFIHDYVHNTVFPLIKPKALLLKKGKNIIN